MQAPDRDGGTTGGAADAATLDGAVVDAGGPVPSTDGGPDTGTANDLDASFTECRPNPDPSDEVCPQMCPETCNGLDDDCDTRIDEHAAVRCALAHASATCVDARCLVDDCVVGYRDCDKSSKNGCEAPEDDIYNCGECARICESDHEVMACDDGTCVPVGCLSGFTSCDESEATCETSLTTLTDCGKCGKTCGPLPNATATCQQGKCAVDACAGNFGNCDGNPKNGCETQLNTASHCAKCDMPCTFAGSDGDCSTGVCVGTMCDPGFEECDEDLSNGCESIDTAQRCGACTTPCNVTAAQHVTAAQCVDETCDVDCVEGYGDCDENPSNGCETPLDTVEHCGECDACPVLAHTTATCDPLTRSCKYDCDQGYDDCMGNAACETSTRTLTDCGSCDVPCNKATCSTGVCSSTDCSATPGFSDCDENGSCETDLGTTTHCGSCTNACTFDVGVMSHATLSCTTQGCKAVCQSNYDDCDGNYKNGCETSLLTLGSCGACGTSCTISNASATCESGQCRVQTCNTDFADCDTSLTTCETSLATVSTCGSCNVTCTFPNAIASCGGSPGSRVCQVASCADADHANCDLVDANGCERDVRPVGSGGQGPCVPESNCARHESAGHEYYVCPTPQTWSEARTRCRLMARGDLARIGDATEKSFVTSKLGAASFVGGHDSSVEGLWVWADNAVPFWRGTSSGASVLGGYAAWQSGEPSGNGDCAALLTAGTFDDVDCTGTRPYVCEVAPDACPSDAAKLDPGQCGCGIADTDADADGFAACNDACDADPAKLAPGACGCGNTETCPAALEWGDARNFDPTKIDFGSAPALSIGCTTATISTTDPDGAGAGVVTYSGWCAAQPQPPASMQTQSDGTQVVVIALSALTVSAGNTLRVVGNRPIILAVGGNATIDGTIDAGARGATPGAGGSVSSTCAVPVDDVAANSTGGLGRGNDSNDLGSAAGGGGGFGAVGQAGGNGADGNARHGFGGAASGATSLSPLRGGCPGGAGGTSTVNNGFGGGGAAGAGGGGLQLTVTGTLLVSATGRIHAGGGGGGVGDVDEEGGGGGGSGGAVLLEAGTLSVNGSAIVKANGGGGGSGRGSNSMFTGTVGSDGGASTAVTSGGAGSRGAGSGGSGGVSGGSAATAGVSGTNFSCGSFCTEKGPGGGGGGGGSGRVVTRTLVVP